MDNPEQIIEQLKYQIHQIQELEAQLLEAKTRANRAKDISPVERPSFRRVGMLARNACMELKKVASGWLLLMGKLQRKFKSLKKIWLLLTQEHWYLSDIFPTQKSAPKYKDAPPRLPKRYPDITKQIFDWQTYVPPPAPDEEHDYWLSHHGVEEDVPFTWSDLWK